MTTPAKKPKPTLSVVKAAPDMDQLERMLTDFAANHAPMLSRSGLARQKAEAEIEALEGELSGLAAKRDLASRTYQALMTSIEAEERDIKAAIGIHSAGLTSASLNAAE